MNYSLQEWSTSSCRVHQQPQDLKFLKTVLATSEDAPESWEDPESIDFDALLDHPTLADTIFDHPGHLPISTGFYFYILLRKSLLEASIDSRDLTDYMVAILVRRLHVDAAFNHTISEGKTYFYIMDSLQKIESADASEQFHLRVKLANQALFLTGLFGEHLKYRTERRGAPGISYYESLGSAQYRAAIDYPQTSKYHLEPIFETLGAEFTSVRHALNDFSERFLRLGEPYWGNS